MTRSRPVLLSEATFVGQGKWSGYWDRRPTPSWRGLRRALAEMLLHNMYGIPVFGTNICGHLPLKTKSYGELCSCWTALGVFFPVFQNSRLWKIEKTVMVNRELAARATKLRQFLQPYMYTLLYKSSVKGDMVAKPTSFEFPDDPKTYGRSLQFMFGSSLLVVPQLVPNVTLLSAYFPRGYWYDMYNNKRIASAGQTTFFPLPLSTTGLFARGGSIIPGEMQRKRSNRTIKEIYLVVSQDSSNYAYGELYKDDGGSPDNVERGQYGLFHFFFMKNVLTGHCSICKAGATLGAATVFGVIQKPSGVTINDRAVSFSFFNTTLYISDIRHYLKQPFTIMWTTF
ncbi:lysosomal alpha-glucosidase-like [Ixodes scapularis]